MANSETAAKVSELAAKGYEKTSSVVGSTVEERMVAKIAQIEERSQAQLLERIFDEVPEVVFRQLVQFL